MGEHKASNNNLWDLQFDHPEHQHLEQALQQALANLTTWVQELEQRIYEIDLLSELDDRLQGCASVEEALALSARFIRQFFRDDSGQLAIFDPMRGCPRAIVTWGDTTWLQGSFVPEKCWAVRHHHERDHMTHQMGASCYYHDQPLLSSFICVPIVVWGETVGLLQVWGGNQCNGNQSASDTAILPEYKQRLAVASIELLALALEKLRFQEKAQAPVAAVAFEKQVER